MTLKELGLSLDTGRKHWSATDIKKLLDLISEKGFTTFHWHFSDFLGFRILLDSYPDIASEEHLTKTEMKELITYAKSKNITIMPEFDTPGHLTPLLKVYPEWGVEQLDDKGELVRSDNALDITNPEARRAIFTILKEIIDLFPNSQYFHLGADEFIPFGKVKEFPNLMRSSQELVGDAASGLESYVAFTNELIDFVKSYGMIPRVWNDGFMRNDFSSLLPLSKDVEICYWTRWDKGMATAQTWLDQGYKMVNYNDNYLYYVLGEHASYTYPTVESVNSGWEPYKFSSEQLTPVAQRKQVVGAYMSVWSDVPTAKTPSEILSDIEPVMAVVFEKVQSENKKEEK